VTPWDFATALYARPGVETACLSLQDVDGQSVPLLLWRLWSLHEAREVDTEVLDRAVGCARTWESSAVAPLREVRRRLKAPLPPVADAARAALRDRVAAAELAAERALLDALGALTPAAGGDKVDVLSALREVGARWGGAPCEAGLRRLVGAVQAEEVLAELPRSATN
jgi:uncharacterized protein (TIGR02444 family)